MSTNATETDADRETLAALVRATTLIAAELAFAALFAYVIYKTWGAAPGQVPSISKPIESSAGALAVALGAGYAVVLGLQPRPGVKARNFFKREILLSTQLLLFIGAFIYMAVGGACGLTYVTNVDESPGLLKTVAIGFGGYVIAYIGAAYRQLTQ